MIVDTDVLIRLAREPRREIAGEATAFFGTLTDTRICITPTIAGEIACGASMSVREAWERFLLPFELIPMTTETAWHYGEQFRALSSRGEMIGASDLWIAATVLGHQLPVATGNTREFQRVAGLSLISV